MTWCTIDSQIAEIVVIEENVHWLQDVPFWMCLTLVCYCKDTWWNNLWASAVFPGIARITWLNAHTNYQLHNVKKHFNVCFLSRTEAAFLGASKASFKGEQLFPLFLYLHHKVNSQINQLFLIRAWVSLKTV